MRKAIVLAICCFAMVACQAKLEETTSVDSTPGESTTKAGATSRESAQMSSPVTEKNVALASLPRLVYYTISDA